MTDQQMEQLIEEITRQVFCYLGDRGFSELRGLEIDEVVCPGCDGRCVEACSEKVRDVLAAGAERVSAGPGIEAVPSEVASMIDHSLLKPEAGREDILRLCAEAKKFGFATVCVNSFWVPLAVAALRGSNVKVGTVVGFPLGAVPTQTKVFEAEQAVKLGAQEIDMVMNIGAFHSGDVELVEQDIRGVVETSHAAGALVKVILECALLSDEEKVRACEICVRAGADFVKTSTGFGPGGATARDVELVRLAVDPEVGVKAAGGIRTWEDLRKMVQAGATRIGASAGVRIVKDAAIDPL